MFLVIWLVLLDWLQTAWEIFKEILGIVCVIGGLALLGVICSFIKEWRQRP